MPQPPHTVQQTFEGTYVVCAQDRALYGSGGTLPPLYCPHCGGNARGEDHTLHPSEKTVDCPFTDGDLYRNCPGCGESLTDTPSD